MSSLKTNFFYQILYQILLVITPIVTTPYISRVLGAENSGIFSYTNTIATYFYIFCMLGIEQYGTRCIAYVRHDNRKVNLIFSELLNIHVFIAVLVNGLYFLTVYLFNVDYKEFLYLQFIYVISAVFDISWLFFGLEKFRITVVYNILIKIASTLSVFVFVNDRGDIRNYILIIVSSYLLTQVIIFYKAMKCVRYRKVPLKHSLRHLKPIVVLFAAVIAANINRLADKFILGCYEEIFELGCFEYADKIVRIPLSFIAALGTVMLSRVSGLVEDKNNEDKISSILLYSGVFILCVTNAMGFGIITIAPEFVIWFLGEEYQKSIILLQILSLTIPIVGWNNFIRTQVLIPNKKDSIYTKAVLTGAFFNVIFNVTTVPYLGSIGSSVSTVISYLIIFAMQTYPIRKSINCNEFQTSFTVFFSIGIISLCFSNLGFCYSHNLFVNKSNLFFAICIKTIYYSIIYCMGTYLYYKRHLNKVFT